MLREVHPENLYVGRNKENTFSWVLADVWLGTGWKSGSPSGLCLPALFIKSLFVFTPFGMAAIKKPQKNRVPVVAQHVKNLTSCP